MIPDAKSATLKAFIAANIAPGSTVVSDGLKSYPSAIRALNNKLNRADGSDGDTVVGDYVHHPVNVKASGKPAHELLPAVHRIFAQAKRMVDGTYQGAGSPEHLGGYLDEFVFRFNRRNSASRGLVFFRLLQRAVVSAPVAFTDLVAVPKAKNIAPKPVAGVRGRPGSLDAPVLYRPWRKQ